MSDSEFEVPRAALREKYSSPPATITSDTISVLPSQPTTSRLALFAIPSTPPLQPAKPPSATASTGATSKKGLSHWFSLKTLTKNHLNSTTTVASTLASITTTKGKVIYKQKKLACSAPNKKVVKDMEHIQRYSLNTLFYNRQYSDILRNQLIRAHCHSLL